MGTARRLVVTVWEGALLRRFVLRCAAQIVSWFLVLVESTRKMAVFSFRLWIVVRRPGMYYWQLGLSVGSCFGIYFLCPLFVAACPAIVMVGTWRDGSQETVSFGYLVFVLHSSELYWFTNVRKISRLIGKVYDRDFVMERTVVFPFVV